METIVRLNSLRLAPRKVRAVVDVVRGKDVPVALTNLEHLVRRPASPILKLLQSAVANAEQNFQMVRENLYVKRVFVNEGVKLKRFMPRAQGRATAIHKTLSRVTLVLDERVPGLKHQVAPKPAARLEPKAVEEPILPSAREAAPRPAEPAKPEVKREIGKKGLFSRITKRIFQRKSV